MDKRNRFGEVVCVVCGEKATRRLDWTNQPMRNGLAFCDQHDYSDLEVHENA